jgi:hypothetical protein
MRNIVRLATRGGPERVDRHRRPAASGRPAANPGGAVVVLFPDRFRRAPAESGAVTRIARLELENKELRRQAVELALQIQALKDVRQ